MKNALCIGVIFLLAACEDTSVTLELTGETMGTTYKVVAIDDSGALEANSVHAAIEETLSKVDARMSNWNPDSEISRFNALENTEPVEISPQLAKVIRGANAIHTQSEGKFDVTLGPLIDLWGFGTRNVEDPSPSEEDITAALARAGQSRVLSLRSGPDMLQKMRPDTQVYLAAIAKGHGVDEVAETLRNLEIENFLVEIGGDLIASGLNPKGEVWRIGIERPDTKTRTVEEIVRMSGYGLATSGDYRNYFEKDGVRYSHIIDAKSGHPITHNTASVTVLADSAMMADGWATAFLALGHTRGIPIAERLGLAVLFILRNDTNKGKPFKTVASSRFLELQAQE